MAFGKVRGEKTQILASRARPAGSRPAAPAGRDARRAASRRALRERLRYDRRAMKDSTPSIVVRAARRLAGPWLREQLARLRAQPH